MNIWKNFDSIIRWFKSPYPSQDIIEHKEKVKLRTLVFNVKEQSIYPNSPSDIGGLVAGTSGYIRAKFLFSDDWKGCIKVVGFKSLDGKEFDPQSLDRENSCFIPSEALEYHEFEIQVFGRHRDYTITTRPIKIKQFGGKK